MTKLIFRPLVVVFAFICSCSEELPDYCPDPIGSDYQTYGDESILCFIEDFNGCFLIDLSSTPTIRSVTIGDGTAASIVDVGARSCIQDVEFVSAGFSSQVQAVAGHGYVIKIEDGTYAKIFIDSEEKFSSGKVDKLNIVRLYPFNN